ncbi:MAG: GTP cyclohydrolase I FolE [Elusimicrobiota bacterium]|jgi:GTP cyclohydrolase I|nr:GTP cyclohydrolase I FolE [Elusimicrobiota bacterium]
MRNIDKAKVCQAVALLLEGLGEDANAERFRKTAERVANFYGEFLTDNKVCAFNQSALMAEHFTGIVSIKAINFFSICEHHLLPFFGAASIAYLPKANKIIGISKLAEIIKSLAADFQIQERLTQEISDLINKLIDPQGVIVKIEAYHLCLSMQGVKETQAKLQTCIKSGIFLQDQILAAQTLELLKD